MTRAELGRQGIAEYRTRVGDTVESVAALLNAAASSNVQPADIAQAASQASACTIADLRFEESMVVETPGRLICVRVHPPLAEVQRRNAIGGPAGQCGSKSLLVK